ncbi:oxidoreductase [Cutaneotrichosporon oleaginosum]|uniref:Oxidoreductase n=1 Tax=Cutaneotrichosporon oleaginosum TaxID=879819 RepID=A0A0J0XZ96_9TREE|nr:oxidoreductase [Cutaneotrichosporon oleaginosum]KLT46378.1 oxidoreductase [Cutaneotrichosporon oleaginosum]TXT15252.1 hypothetical protein COLE_01445 [Cutaneotrichosporon oleaginosum]
MSQDQQRVAVVTGAGSGFGAAIARKFAKDGVAVVVCDINDDAGKAVTDDINAKGGKAIYVNCDVAKREAWERLLAETTQKFGGVNFVINNAGATYKNKPVLDTTERDFDLCFDVNMKSVFHSVHVMIPALRETRKRGGPAAIVNVASTAGIMGRPGLTWYAASKAACISCTKNLAIEFGPEQIRFNAICPVFGNTGLKHMFMGETTEDMFIKSIPLGRCSEPEDIANSTVFLCSDEASFLTGVALPVDGGRLA